MPRPADCKPAVFKQAGSDQWRTTTIPHHFGHEEDQQTHLPVEQGKAGAAPVVPANFIPW